MKKKGAVQEQHNELRVPPQNVEAEQSVLGGALLDNTVLNNVVELLAPEDFYKSAHQKIYSAMLELSEKGDPIDTITLNNYLKLKNELENVGDTSYIAFLSSSVPTAANVEYYAKIVREKALLRKVISLATSLSSEAYNEAEDIDSFLDHVEQSVYAISNDKIRPSFYSMKDLIKSSFKTIEELYHKKQLITGIHSGFSDLDEITSGFQPSDLIIIAARPSMGKTALALNIAQKSAIEHGSHVVVFSLEMSKEQLVTRMLCTEAEVDMQRVRSGYFSESEWPKLTRAAGTLNEAPIYIDDTPAITVLELRAKCRRLKAEDKLDMVIVDYLQLMQGRGRTDSREQEISMISRSLKALAKELHVPVIALSQLNRALEQRENKRPRLSDLRESGAIEQDADVIGFIYRDEVYKKDSKDDGVAELIVGKQRNGPTGTVRLAFRKQYTKFADLDESHEDYGFDDD
jgi:replicative DNA helicase